MRRFIAVALVALGFAAPLCAQRGASRGGFSSSRSFSSSSFHGSFAPGSRGFTAAPQFSGGRPVTLAPGQLRTQPAYYGGRRDYGGRRNTVPYAPYYGAFLPYGYSGDAGWIDADDTAYPDVPDQGPPVSQPAYDASGGYDSQPPDQSQQMAPQQVQQAPPPPRARASQAAPPENEDAVTLIFKDGRPPEQIHNYILTRTTLYVRDQHHRDIPVDQLDLAATEKANQLAGVDFQLPTPSK